MNSATSYTKKLAWLNSLPPAKAKAELFRCCGATAWVERLIKCRPFRSEAELFIIADREWHKSSNQDYLESFSHHPKIGDLNSLKSKFSSTGDWASGEQSGVNHAPEQTLADLARLNAAYLQKFSYIFIICATGKNAPEMLNALKDRMQHTPEVELKVAAEEQRKITRIRLEKLVRS